VLVASASHACATGQQYAVSGDRWCAVDPDLPTGAAGQPRRANLRDRSATPGRPAVRIAARVSIVGARDVVLSAFKPSRSWNTAGAHTVLSTRGLQMGPLGPSPPLPHPKRGVWFTHTHVHPLARNRSRLYVAFFAVTLCPGRSCPRFRPQILQLPSLAGAPRLQLVIRCFGSRKPGCDVSGGS
jgi:hypothetical protein